MRLLSILLLLLGLTASPVLAAEQAVALKPTDTATIRTCFLLASVRFLKADLEDSEEEDEEFVGPSPRAILLGWERALTRIAPRGA